MLKKIDLVSDKKIDKEALNKIRGGCICARCICGTKPATDWSNDTYLGS